jgi:hypothetical protein
VSGVWDTSVWDTGQWAGSPPPEPGWGDDWRWWFQYGPNPFQQINLNPLLVEARWTTDSHTMGDGTFRGDLQPGTVTVRMWDPQHALDLLNKSGTLWAQYKPTSAAWCWFYESFTRGLFAPGDPTDADCVYTGTLWPNRLVSESDANSFGAQSCSARLTSIVNQLAAQAGTLNLPAITGSIAPQSQQMIANPVDSSTGLYPGTLQCIRDASSNGIGWMQPTVDSTTVGRLIINYARWETTNERNLDLSQVVAGPPTTASQDWLVTQVRWSAINPAGANTVAESHSGAVNTWGYQTVGPMRLWGDVGSGPERLPALNTASTLMGDRGSPSEPILSSVSLQSGLRWTADGRPAVSTWDPWAHVFNPTDVLLWPDPQAIGGVRKYRVSKSDHRLTATVWQTTHYLDKLTAPQPLPA